MSSTFNKKGKLKAIYLAVWYLPFVFIRTKQSLHLQHHVLFLHYFSAMYQFRKKNKRLETYFVSNFRRQRPIKSIKGNWRFLRLLKHGRLAPFFVIFHLNSWQINMSYDDRNIIDDFRGSFSNDDGDGNEDVKKAIGLSRKTTTLHVHHTFLYISLSSLHDYDRENA